MAGAESAFSKAYRRWILKDFDEETNLRFNPIWGEINPFSSLPISADQSTLRSEPYK
jgi:hypothetical protein